MEKIGDIIGLVLGLLVVGALVWIIIDMIEKR